MEICDSAFVNGFAPKRESDKVLNCVYADQEDCSADDVKIQVNGSGTFRIFVCTDTG